MAPSARAPSFNVAADAVFHFSLSDKLETVKTHARTVIFFYRLCLLKKMSTGVSEV